MSDMVYAPCEHGRLGRCPLPADCPCGGAECDGVTECNGGRPLGTVDEIERALRHDDMLRRLGGGHVALRKAAAYDAGERWCEYADGTMVHADDLESLPKGSRWVRIVKEVEDE